MQYNDNLAQFCSNNYMYGWINIHSLYCCFQMNCIIVCHTIEIIQATIAIICNSIVNILSPFCACFHKEQQTLALNTNNYIFSIFLCCLNCVFTGND